VGGGHFDKIVIGVRVDFPVMKIPAKSLHDPTITCSSCAACCCRLEVLLITDTNVPEAFVEFDRWGGARMRRLEDGWCAALDRNTQLCTIYEQRPLICREFAMGSDECIAERQALR
jgi:uncharacterized protein